MSKKHELFPWVMQYMGQTALPCEPPERRRVTICDLLIKLRSMFYRQGGPSSALAGPSPMARNGEFVSAIRELCVSLFQKSDIVVLSCDQTEHVPIAKGHTQASRRIEPGVLPDYELLNPNLDPLLRLKHQQAMVVISNREEEEAGNQSRYSFVNDDDLALVCEKLGLNAGLIRSMPPSEQRRAIYNASLSHPIPSPWEFAVSSHSGNRPKTMRYLTMALVASQRCLNPHPGGYLVIDGHCADMAMFEQQPNFTVGLPSDVRLQDCPLILSHSRPATYLKDSFIPMDTGDTTPKVGVTMPVRGVSGTRDVDFHNTLGEADHKMIHIIHRLHTEAPPENKDAYYEIITTDTDTFLQVLWYLTQEYFLERVPQDDLPRILLNRRLAKEQNFYDMRALFAKLRLQVGEGHKFLSAKEECENMLSFLTACFAFGSDYTVGFPFITIERLMGAYVKYTGNCLPPLVELDGDAEFELRVRVVPGYYTLLYRLAFYEANQKKCDALAKKLGLDFPEDMDAGHLEAIGADLIQSRLPVVDNPTIAFAAFRSALTILSKGAMPADQLLARLLLLQNYVSLVSQLGRDHLRLLNPMYFGYRRVDDSLPVTSDNVEMQANSDYYGLKSAREQIFRTLYSADKV